MAKQSDLVEQLMKTMGNVDTRGSVSSPFDKAFALEDVDSKPKKPLFPIQAGVDYETEGITKYKPDPYEGEVMKTEDQAYYKMGEKAKKIMESSGMGEPTYRKPGGDIRKEPAFPREESYIQTPLIQTPLNYNLPEHLRNLPSWHPEVKAWIEKKEKFRMPTDNRLRINRPVDTEEDQERRLRRLRQMQEEQNLRQREQILRSIETAGY